MCNGQKTSQDLCHSVFHLNAQEHEHAQGRGVLLGKEAFLQRKVSLYPQRNYYNIHCVTFT